MIDDLRIFGEWKNNLRLKINFMSSNDSDGCKFMHSKGGFALRFLHIDTY